MEPGPMRITYEHQLAEIERDTLVLANMVERAVADSHRVVSGRPTLSLRGGSSTTT